MCCLPLTCEVVYVAYPLPVRLCVCCLPLTCEVVCVAGASVHPGPDDPCRPGGDVQHHHHSGQCPPADMYLAAWHTLYSAGTLPLWVGGWLVI